MTSSAIGGELNGVDLVELPVGEKTTWKSWRERYPQTLVLSVEGVEHDERNPYEDYFASDETFRGLQIEDRRLEPKQPIYAFWIDGRPYAAPHAAFEGGALFETEMQDGQRVLLYRPPGAPLLESSRAFRVSGELAASGQTPLELVTMAESGRSSGIEPLAGFDTFWYSWIAVNPSSRLLR